MNTKIFVCVEYKILLSRDNQRFSSFIKLIRVAACILRFIWRLKKEKFFFGPLTVTVLREAKILWRKSIRHQNDSDVKMAAMLMLPKLRKVS